MNRVLFMLLTTIACVLLVILGVSVVSHRMAPMISEVLSAKREVVRKDNCSRIVKATVYKKTSLFFGHPYENHVVLEDGRTEVFDSIFIYEKGELRCHFWTEPVR